MITKPHDYRHSFPISHDVAYEVSGSQKGTHSGSGMLHTGRVVWIREQLPVEGSEPCVSAYVEGVGVISVDAHILRKASF